MHAENYTANPFPSQIALAQILDLLDFTSTAPANPL
jgi:hypothetical protein